MLRRNKIIIFIMIAIFIPLFMGAYIGLNSMIPNTVNNNSAWDMLHREAGRHICVDATISGTGEQIVNVFQFTGSVRITNQYATITRVGTLTNLTNCYATIFDGTNTVDLTADGAVLSNAPVGTFFTKDMVATEPYTIVFADECRVKETLAGKKSGSPFTITAKNGADNYIQFRYTTTDNPVDFDMRIHFEYILIGNSTLTEL